MYENIVCKFQRNIIIILLNVYYVKEVMKCVLTIYKIYSIVLNI